MHGEAWAARLRRIEDGVFRQLGRAERILLRYPADVVIRPSRANRWIFRGFAGLLGIVLLLGLAPKPMRVKALVILLCVVVLAACAILIVESYSNRR